VELYSINHREKNALEGGYKLGFGQQDKAFANAHQIELNCLLSHTLPNFKSKRALSFSLPSTFL